MRVFVAGASGAIGRPLVHRLREDGHEVHAMTRSPRKVPAIGALGATPVLCDALDGRAVRTAVEAARPDVVINELTAFPLEFDLRRVDFAPTNRLRTEAARNLIDAALSAGARRFISQSIAFLYAPEGEWVKDEHGKPLTGAPGGFGSAVRATLEGERATLETAGLEGVVLRYGQVYGPATYYAPDGSVGRQVRARKFPIVGSGEGRTSFLHVEDAASATVAAADRGAPGVYNVCDDDPARFADWLPLYAEVLGAKQPRRVPTWVARLVAGKMVTETVKGSRGALNSKAKAELGWSPAWSSWRQGFREALG